MNRIGKIAILLSGLIATGAANADNDSPDASLMATAAAYLDLLMCANTAEEFQSAPLLASGYRQSAFALADRAKASGWNDEFDSALVTVQESYRKLEISDSDTRKDWQLRHFANDHCQRQLAVAARQLE